MIQTISRSIVKMGFKYKHGGSKAANIGTVFILDISTSKYLISALFAGFIWLLENLSSFTFIEDRHAMFYNP